jgi:hypothetical protein
MMTVYDIEFDVDKFQIIVPANSKDFDGGNLWIDGTLKGASWGAPTLRYSEKANGQSNADITYISPGFFAFSEKSVHALGQILPKNGELFGFEIDGEMLHAFNPHNEIDCFDDANAEFNTRRNGSRGSRLIKPAFDKTKLKGVDIFQVPEFIKTKFYVTESFKVEYDKAGLTGLLFYAC